MKYLVIFILSLVSVVGCSKKEAAPTKKKFFVRGDPANLVKGTELNQTKTKIPSGFDFDNLQLIGIINFDEIVPIQSAKEQVAEASSSSDEAKEQENKTYYQTDKEVVQAKTLRLIVDTERGPQTDLIFEFKMDGDDIELLKIFSLSGKKEERFLKKLSHLSLKDGVLALGVYLPFPDIDGTGRSYNIVYFANPKRNAFKKLNKRFFYSNGLGQGVRIEKYKLEIEVCPSAEYMTEAISNAVQEWNSALGGKRQITAAAVEKCSPPFDLDSHTIHAPAKFDFSEADDFKTYGITFTPDVNTILDADIVMNTDAIQILNRYEPENLGFSLKKYILHEMGHMLGLQHNFGTDGERTELSVMCYDDECDSTTLFEYDKAAIKELYSY